VIPQARFSNDFVSNDFVSKDLYPSICRQRILETIVEFIVNVVKKSHRLYGEASTVESAGATLIENRVRSDRGTSPRKSAALLPLQKKLG